MNPLVLKLNNTTRFLLPILYAKGLKYNDVLNNFFISAYIADIDRPENDSRLSLKYMTIDAIPKELDGETTHDPEDDSFLVTFDIPEEFMDDYYKFLSGEYSKFSKKLKEYIMSFWEEDNKSALYGVLYHKKNLVKQVWAARSDLPLEAVDPKVEYWPYPRMEKEILGLAI